MGHQFMDAGESIATWALLAEITNELLRHIQPEREGRSEVK